MSFEDERYAITSQGVPKIGSELPETRRESWNTFSLTSLQRNQFC